MTNKNIYLFLACLCFIIYSNGLQSSFISDDYKYLHKLDTFSFFHSLPRPDILLDLLNFHIGKLNPITFHLTNVVLHSINAILVFTFLRLFCSKMASFLGAVLFCVHPINTEAVNWITARYYLVITFLVLITYLLYNKATKEKINILSYLLTLSIFSYFILSNVGFYSAMPFFLILNDVYFKRIKKNYKLWIPFFLILIISFKFQISTVTFQIQNSVNNSNFLDNLLYILVDLDGKGLYEFLYSNYWVWVINSWFVFLNNFFLLIYPIKLTLYHDPLYIPYSKVVVEVIGSSLALSIPLFFIFYFYIKRLWRKPFFIIMFFVFSLLPLYSPAMIASLIAERYLYLSSITISLIIAFIYEKIKTQKIEKIFIIIFLLIINIYSIRTILRNEDYRSLFTFTYSSIKTSPYSYRAHNDMGFIYLQMGRFKEAENELLYSLELEPNIAFNKSAITNLIRTYNAQGKKIDTLTYNKKRGKWSIFSFPQLPYPLPYPDTE